MRSSSTPFTATSVREIVKNEVPDWDDEVATTARFKAFSGQRSDWEPRFIFWRDLILKVARNLGVCVVRASELKNVWFSRGVLIPLCLDQVMHEMHANGDIILKEELTDPNSGPLYRLLKQAWQLRGFFRTFSLQDYTDDTLIIRILLQERAADVIKTIAASNWTSTCVVTMRTFQLLSKGSDEAFAILSYLCENKKAYFLSAKKGFIKGIKLSLALASVSAVTDLDYHVLHLMSTTEKLQQQIDTVDQRWDTSRKMAVASLRSGNKQAAYRHLRQAKLFSVSRNKCTSFLERVEEVLAVIADAESTKKVSEALQIGARAIKENRISVEEVDVQLQELDVLITDQKQIDEAIENMSSLSVDYENEVDEEFEKLEMELAREMPRPQPQPQLQYPAEHKQARNKESHESLSQNLSKLNLEAA